MDNEPNNNEVPRPDYEAQIAKLLEDNLKLSSRILLLTEKNNQMLRLQRYMGFIKFLIILIPIVFGIIYLPPLFEKVFDFYNEMLGFDVFGAFKK